MATELRSYRAWRCHTFGDYNDLRIESVPRQALQAGQIRIANRAFAAGFPDMLMVQGGYQLKPPLPFTPCSEFAGEVIDSGDDSGEFRCGDRVMGSVRAGAAADEVVIDAEYCLPLPEAFDFATAAAFNIGYKTAYVGLVVRGQLQAGETVLIHGAAGGVGLAALDLARLKGANVIAMATGAEKLAILRQHGAQHVLDYRDGGFRETVKSLTDGRGADVIYDPIGGDVFDESMRCIAPFGRLLIIGFASGRIPQVGVNLALIKQISIIGVRAGEYGRLNPAGGAKVQRALGEFAESGQLTPHIHTRLPFSGLLDGFNTVADRRVVGRVVVEI